MRQLAERGGNVALQAIVLKIQLDEFGEAAQLSGKLAHQVVVPQVEDFQVFEAADLGGELAQQAVGRQRQPGDPIFVVGGYAVPAAQRPVAEPAARVAPAISPGGLVEGDQSLAVIL